MKEIEVIFVEIVHKDVLWKCAGVLAGAYLCHRSPDRYGANLAIPGNDHPRLLAGQILLFSELLKDIGGCHDGTRRYTITALGIDVYERLEPEIVAWGARTGNPIETSDTLLK